MAVLGRLKIGSQQRVDLTDLLAIDSYVSSDFRHLVKSFVGDNALVLKGFEVVDASLAIGTPSLSIKIADSVLYNPLSSAGSFYYGLPEGDTLSQPLTPSLKPNALNYIYLTLTTVGAGQDTKAFWDVDLNGGEGGEFNQDINTESVLTIQVNSSVSSFPNGSIPVCKVQVAIDGNIQSITDARNLMFRLGSGGVSPDPSSTYNFRSLPTATYQRSEPGITANTPSSPTPFFGGDKNIFTLKEWMDVVMTRLLELGGSTYWYEAPASLSLLNIFDDVLGTSIKSKGQWEHDTSTPGLIKWSEDIIYRKTNDPREIIVRANSSGVTLADGQVMWVELQRNINYPVTLSFTNSSAIVTSALGDFADFIKGDWIKGKNDTDNQYLRIDEFYSDLGATTPSSPALALSVRLSGLYQGLTYAVAQVVYTRGVIENVDIKVNDRKDLDMVASGGNFFWLANRSDTIQKVASSVPVSFSATVNTTAVDGVKATLTFPSAHGLNDDDRIWVSLDNGSPAIKVVEILSTTTLSIQTTDVTLHAGLTVRWEEITTGVRDNGYGLQLESATHGFKSGQVITTSTLPYSTDNSNGIGAGHFVITVPSTNSFRIAAQAVPGLTSGTLVNKANVLLKTEFGALNVIQGESIDINQPETDNILSFIGMNSIAETSPQYALPAGYNTINDTQHFNSSPSDNLTQRVAKLTSMMADRVQDRGIHIAGRLETKNEYLSGTVQKVTLTGTISVHKPSGSSQSITLSGSPFSLLANECVYVSISRNAGTATVATVGSFNSSTILDENKLILAWRTTSTDVQTFEGQRVLSGARHTSGENETAQSKNISVKDTVGTNYNATTGEWLYNTTGANVIINIPGSSVVNQIDTAAVMAISAASRTVVNGQAVWIRVNRKVAKTFNVVITGNATYQDTNIAGALYIDTMANIPTDQDVLVLYVVQSGSMMKMHHHNDPVGNIYEENKNILIAVTALSLIALPIDSRNGGDNQFYLVGAGQLELYLNGQKILLGTDWLENGAGGTLSNTIQIQQNLVIGDVLTFRIGGTGGIFFVTGGGGGSQSLQDTYNIGNTITISSGSPITINGPVSEKLLVVNGDMDVTGVIDPKGITFTREATNPLGATQDGLWNNSVGELVYKRNGYPDSNITQAIESVSAITKLSVQMANTSGVSIPQFYPVYIDTSGDASKVDVSIEVNAKAVVGIAATTIPNLSSGEIITYGVVPNIGAFNFGDILYISKTGALTNVVPDIGLGSPVFVAGDFVVKIGVVMKNSVIPTQKDLVLSVQVMGQLA